MDSVADAVFLRRILYAMMGLTILTGILATSIAVDAINADPSTCMFGCSATHPMKIASAENENLNSP